mmetsp:Transcript_65559/g.118077  ORF Transcript_65559/g.118077 Transcript_65559/m.118077 type:complete len:209 (-) Transcript_65559:130-756(-)
MRRKTAVMKKRRKQAKIAVMMRRRRQTKIAVTKMRRRRLKRKIPIQTQSRRKRRKHQRRGDAPRAAGKRLSARAAALPNLARKSRKRLRDQKVTRRKVVSVRDQDLQMPSPGRIGAAAEEGVARERARRTGHAPGVRTARVVLEVAAVVEAAAADDPDRGGESGNLVAPKLDGWRRAAGKSAGTLWLCAAAHCIVSLKILCGSLLFHV